MEGQNYKISPLKETANYDCCSEDIQKVLALDHCWLVAIGKKFTPNTLRALFEKRPASVSGDVGVEAVVNTELTKYMYEAKMEKHGKKLLDYNDKYS